MLQEEDELVPVPFASPTQPSATTASTTTSANLPIPFPSATTNTFAMPIMQQQQEEEEVQEQMQFAQNFADEDERQYQAAPTLGSGGGQFASLSPTASASASAAAAAAAARRPAPAAVTKVRTQVLYLTANGAILRIPLRSVVTMRMQDPELEAQLTTVLSHKRFSRFPKPRATNDTTISIIADSATATAAAGLAAASRVRKYTVTASYVSESSPWSCSYRLEAPSSDTVVVHGQHVMDIKDAMQTHEDDDDDGEGGDENGEGGTREHAAASSSSKSVSKRQLRDPHEVVVLHVMARIQNTSDYDWRDVEISLVANDLQLVEDPTKAVKAAAGSSENKLERFFKLKQKKEYSGGFNLFVKVREAKKMGCMCVCVYVCVCMCVWVCGCGCACVNVRVRA